MINLNEYEYVANRNGYFTYRKIVDGKGIWAAQDQDKKNEPFPITYDQALGYDPISQTPLEELQHELGEMLLPKEMILHKKGKNR